MEIRKAFEFYKSWYFIVPVLSVVLAIVLNTGSSKPKKKQEPSQEKEPKKST